MVVCPKCSHSFELPKITSYSEDFLSFWKAYDVKSKSPAASKSDAFKAWNQIEAVRPPLNNLLHALKGYQSHIVKSNGIICHPSTWLRQGRYESFLPTGTDVISTSESPSSASGPSVHESWGEVGKLISSEIGPAKFIYWFREAVLQPGKPAVITVGNRFKKDWIDSKYSYALHKVLGAYQVVVQSK